MDADNYAFTVVREMSANSTELYDAWVRRFDAWFAETGRVAMRDSAGAPFWFEVVHEGERYAHYGRFLQLEPDRLIEMTWVTGRNGTDGAETVVRVELVARESATTLTLTHGGFYDEAASRRHRDSWPSVLEHLDAVLAGG